MIRDNVVMITGAARGIGAGTARRLHQLGARLVLVDIDESGLEALAAGLDGDRVLYVAADVNDFGAMRAVGDAAVTRFGAVHVVVANAGIELWSPVHSVDPDAFRKVIETNVVGVFHSVRAVLPSIIDHRGYILVISSVSAYTAVPGMAAYGASKAGAEQFANVLRLELADHGVAVGSAHMSLVDSPLIREMRSNSAGFARILESLPRLGRREVPLEVCVARLVDAIEHRRRHVDVPTWVALARWVKPLLSSSLAQRRLAQVMRDVDLR